jgi:hypothetical protein
MMKFLSMKVVEDDVHSKPTNMLPASVMTRLFLIMVWTMEDSLGLWSNSSIQKCKKLLVSLASIVKTGQKLKSIAYILYTD